MKRGALLLSVVLFASCGGGEPEVDWSQVPSNQQVLIDEAVTGKDCERMQTYFDGSEEADVLAYLDWHMEEAGCY